MIVISLIYDKRAIPIYFEVLPKLGNTNAGKQIEVVSRVLPLLSDYTKIILGDREFCSVDLDQWLRSQPQTYFVKEKRRTQRRHRIFYIGLHAYTWMESLDLFCEQTAKLMSLSPRKLPYYQRGRQAQKLIQSNFEL